MKFCIFAISFGLIFTLVDFTHAQNRIRKSKINYSLSCTKLLHLEPTVRVREYKNTLNASLQTEVEIDRTMKSLASYAGSVLGVKVEISDIELRPLGFDKKIGWDDYIILVGGIPVGFSDGFIPLPKNNLN